MEVFNINILRPYQSPVVYVMTCIIITIGLPLTLAAIYAVYSLVKNDHVAPIYIINLLISDVIQLCCMIVDVVPLQDRNMYYIAFCMYYFAMIASVGFMVCIALERYLVIACPLWYRFRRTIKISVVVCVMVWVLTLVYLLTYNYVKYTEIISAIFFFLPLPLFIFFLGGTIKALSASRVPSDEKRRIVAILVLVLLIYTLLFMPSVIWYATYYQTLTTLSFTFLRLSPLADLLLYVFMRKGTIDKFLASVCCCRMDSNDSSRMDSNDITSSTV
ncbi:proteinase-activated receptor 1-like [Sparus aurata]|uniref:proteinase-activated receptor 1-like n=1 Tax=Sparus aurata TaxID=8175 RepID=UPI0011C14323|nr:proteinase-activated receptor 1-like [Sparus aurata]